MTSYSTSDLQHSLSSEEFCRNMSLLQLDVCDETTHLDNILRDLCRYYKEVKT